MTKHTPSVPTLAFHETTFHPITRKGQPWLTAAEIGKAMGYLDDKSIHRAYARHSAEFTEHMTGVVKLTTPSGEQDVRVFSLRGAHLLGMFARTERAAEFRRWVLDILDAQNEGTAQRRAKPGANALTVQPAPQARAGISKELRQHINRTAHQIALKQYDTIHAILTECAADNLACGAKEADVFSYVEAYADTADGVCIANVRDLKELVWNAEQVINTAAQAVANIRRIEQRSGYQLAMRIKRSEWENPEFHKHDRLVQEVLERMTGEDA